MKNHLLTIVLILAFQLSKGSNYDSLIQISDTIQNPSEKVDWLTGTAYDFYTIDPDITEKLGLLALELSHNQEYEFGVARAHHILGIAYWTKGLLEKGLVENLAAMKIYEELKENRWLRIIQMNSANIRTIVNRWFFIVDRI